MHVCALDCNKKCIVVGHGQRSLNSHGLGNFSLPYMQSTVVGAEVKVTLTEVSILRYFLSLDQSGLAIHVDSIWEEHAQSPLHLIERGILWLKYLTPLSLPLPWSSSWKEDKWHI